MSKFKKGDKVTFVSSDGFPLIGAFEGKGGTIQGDAEPGYYVKNDPDVTWAMDVTYWTEKGLKLAETVDNGPLKVGDTVKFASVTRNDDWLAPFYGKTGVIAEITNAYNVKVTHGDDINWGSDYTYWQHSQLEKVGGEATREKPKPTLEPGMLVKFTGAVKESFPTYGIIQQQSATTPDVWLVNHRQTYSNQTWWEESCMEPVIWGLPMTTDYRVGEKVTLKDNAPWFPGGECVIYDVSYGKAALHKVLFKLRPHTEKNVTFADGGCELELDEFKNLEWNTVWFVKTTEKENIKAFVDEICKDEPNTMVIPTPGKTPMSKKHFVALAEAINGLDSPVKTKKALCDALSPVLAQTNSNYDPYVFYEAACE